MSDPTPSPRQTPGTCGIGIWQWGRVARALSTHSERDKVLTQYPEATLHPRQVARLPWPPASFWAQQRPEDGELTILGLLNAGCLRHYQEGALLARLLYTILPNQGFLAPLWPPMLREVC